MRKIFQNLWLQILGIYLLLWGAWSVWALFMSDILKATGDVEGGEIVYKTTIYYAIESLYHLILNP